MSAAAPTFSVIVPAFNAARTIDAALRSVLAQTRPDFEVIVVDDGSTDATAARVEAHAADARVVLVRQDNAGPAVARNTAVARMRGRLATLLDSDDLLMPRYLERMGAALDADPGAGWAYTDPWVMDDRLRRIRRHSFAARTRPPGPLPADAPGFLRLLVAYNFVFVASTIRRSALEDVGGFDPSLARAHDYEMWLRLCAHGHRPAEVAEHLAIYRVGQRSLSADRELVGRSVCEALRRVAEDWPVPEPERALARLRREQLDRERAGATGERGPLVAARHRADALATALRQRVLRRRKWPAEPPAEVRAAFPDLVEP